MNAMILAAGLGTRLRPYTLTVPKPAIPFMTVPLAVYPLFLWQEISINNLVVNTHHLPAEIEKLFADIGWPSWQLIFSPEPTILGSSGGIRQAFAHLRGDGNFLVANADEVLLPAAPGMMERALKFHRGHGGIATAVCVRHPGVGTQFGGIWVPDGSSTKVTVVGKSGPAGHCGLHYTGVMILSDRIGKYFSADLSSEEHIFKDTLARAMAAGEEFHAFETEAQWFETGNPADFLSAIETCCEALSGAGVRPGWAAELARIIGQFGVGRTLIESAERPDLHARVLNVVRRG